VNSNEPPDAASIDLDRDVPTTPEDVRTLRACRASTPGWLGLTAEELDAILPDEALDRRPTAAGRRPFSLD
jgi:hypothetical protein